MEVKKSRLKIIVLVSIIVMAILIGVSVAVNATGSGEIVKSKTFNENMDGYYVYFRAVDEAGNAGDWSNSQRIWIDTKAPNVSAKNSSVTIEEGTVELLASYFNIDANGGNDDIDVVCTIGGVEYDDTETLTAEGSPYTVVCTASKNGGKSKSAEMELVVEPSGPTPWDGTVATSFARGTGTEADPYIIETPEQLAYLAQTTNAGTNNYKGVYFKQGSDLDLGGIQAENGTWSGQQWTPIGINRSFYGNFDGNGYHILNIYINSGESTDRSGLFGRISNDYTDVTIKNINLISGYINVPAASRSGAIIGYANANASYQFNISNCINYAEVIGKYEIGGICGFAEFDTPTIMNCINYGNITAIDGAAGGIIGGVWSGISDLAENGCANYGTIMSEGKVNNKLCGLELGYVGGSND